MQQSSATPKNQDVGRGLRKIVAYSRLYRAVCSCVTCFWHGVIPTSYIIFNDFYTCIYTILHTSCILYVYVMCICLKLIHGNIFCSDKDCCMMVYQFGSGQGQFHTHANHHLHRHNHTSSSTPNRTTTRTTATPTRTNTAPTWTTATPTRTTATPIASLSAAHNIPPFCICTTNSCCIQPTVYGALSLACDEINCGLKTTNPVCVQARKCREN